MERVQSQEFYCLLMVHFAIRGLMHQAALKVNEDPNRLSFVHAVRPASLGKASLSRRCLSSEILVRRPCDLVIDPPPVRAWTPAQQPVWRPRYAIPQSRGHGTKFCSHRYGSGAGSRIFSRNVIRRSSVNRPERTADQVSNFRVTFLRG